MTSGAQGEKDKADSREEKRKMLFPSFSSAYERLLLGKFPKWTSPLLAALIGLSRVH